MKTTFTVRRMMLGICLFALLCLIAQRSSPALVLAYHHTVQEREHRAVQRWWSTQTTPTPAQAALFAAYARDQADYHLYWRNRFLASALAPVTTLPVTSQDYPRRRTLAQLRAEGVGIP